MKLHYTEIFPETRTSRPDVVLIHGTGSSSEMWERQLEYLRTHGYRSFAIDLRGHGKSDEPLSHTDLEVHLNDVLETLESTDIKYPAVFIGHSLGAILSIVIAEKFPERVQRIFAAALPGRILKPMELAFRWFLNGPFPKIREMEFRNKLAWRERTLLSTPVHTLQQIVDNFGDVNFVDKPINVSCPVHFSVGRFDPVAPCMYVTRIHKTMPTSTLDIYEWSGHNFMDLHYHRFNQWLTKHLNDDTLHGQ